MSEVMATAAKYLHIISCKLPQVSAFMEMQTLSLYFGPEEATDALITRGYQQRVTGKAITFFTLILKMTAVSVSCLNQLERNDVQNITKKNSRLFKVSGLNIRLKNNCIKTS